MLKDTPTPDSIDEKTLVVWYRTMRETLTHEEATRRVLQALTQKLQRKLERLTFHTPEAKAEAVEEVHALYERLCERIDLEPTPTFLDHVQRIIPEAYAAHREEQQRAA